MWPEHKAGCGMSVITSNLPTQCKSKNKNFGSMTGLLWWKELKQSYSLTGIRW